jgi:hypothetical protein
MLPVSVVSQSPKIFCIGWHRTGTTSIGAALRRLGYRVGGWEPACGELIVKWHRGDLAPIMARAMAFEAFEDNPWPLVFAEMDAAFPQARFILTTRATEAVWLDSIRSHTAVRYPGRAERQMLIYGTADPVNDGDRYVARYLAHNAAVRSHFKDRPGKLLEMCFERGDGWAKLCLFLAKWPVPDEPFPHKNKSRSGRSEAGQNVSPHPPRGSRARPQ